MYRAYYKNYNDRVSKTKHGLAILPASQSRDPCVAPTHEPQFGVHDRVWGIIPFPHVTEQGPESAQEVHVSLGSKHDRVVVASTHPPHAVQGWMHEVAVRQPVQLGGVHGSYLFRTTALT